MGNKRNRPFPQQLQKYHSVSPFSLFLCWLWFLLFWLLLWVFLFLKFMLVVFSSSNWSVHIRLFFLTECSSTSCCCRCCWKDSSWSTFSSSTHPESLWCFHTITISRSYFGEVQIFKNVSYYESERAFFEFNLLYSVFTNTLQTIPLFYRMGFVACPPTGCTLPGGTNSTRPF